MELNHSIHSPLTYHEVHQNHGQKVMDWPCPDLIPGVQANPRLSWPLEKTHRRRQPSPSPAPLLLGANIVWSKRRRSPPVLFLVEFVCVIIRHDGALRWAPQCLPRRPPPPTDPFMLCIAVPIARSLIVVCNVSNRRQLSTRCQHCRSI